MTKTQYLAPIQISEDEQPALYRALIEENKVLRRNFLGATEKVLGIMLRNGLTRDPERRAVWCKQMVFWNGNLMMTFMDKVGESFPNGKFDSRCFSACQENVKRTQKNPDHICSHESRDPKNGKDGGSAQITFELASSQGKISTITFIGAPSGLEEWENLILEIGKYRYLGLVDLEDEQIQEILQRADASVKDDPTARPEGMTISQKASEIFEVIDTDPETAIW
jgi:hypothetical protein